MTVTTFSGSTVKMAAITSFLCRSCRLSSPRSSAIHRTFVTTCTRSGIPPESPNYVDIPETFQTDFYPPQRPKGILPVPREIFPPRRPDKPSEQYLSRVARPPTKKAVSSPQSSRKSEQIEYKTRMSELRRNNLRSGLLELYKRKVVTTQQIAAKSNRRQNERARLISQLPREDERLTGISIPSSMRISPGGSHSSTSTPSPSDAANAAATHARRLATTESKSQAKRESRRDALHTLYMHARSFITTEAHLGAEIDRVFDDTQDAWGTSTEYGSNIWNLGIPVKVATMLRDLHQSTGPGTDKDPTARMPRTRGSTTRFRTDQERMKKLAEALTGGTM